MRTYAKCRTIYRLRQKPFAGSIINPVRMKRKESCHLKRTVRHLSSSHIHRAILPLWLRLQHPYEWLDLHQLQLCDSWYLTSLYRGKCVHCSRGMHRMLGSRHWPNAAFSRNQYLKTNHHWRGCLDWSERNGLRRRNDRSWQHRRCRQCGYKGYS